MWSPDSIEFDYLRESQSAGRKTTNQISIVIVGHDFYSLKVLMLAVDLPLLNVMFSRQLCLKGYLNRIIYASRKEVKLSKALLKQNLTILTVSLTLVHTVLVSGEYLQNNKDLVKLDSILHKHV